MADSVKFNNLFDEGFQSQFQAFVQSIGQLNESFEQSISSIKSNVSDLKKQVKEIDIKSPNASKELSELSKESDKYEKELKQVKKAQKENNKTAEESKKQYKSLSKQVSEAKTKYEQARKEFGANSKQAQLAAQNYAKLKVETQSLNTTLKQQTDSARDLSIIQNDNVGTLEKLTAQNRILRREREGLNLETEEGKKRLEEINKELDENNEEIKENSDNLKKQKLNVGNYKEDVKGAASELGLMNGKLGIGARVMAQFSSAIRLGGTAFKSFNRAIASTGVGALILAIGAIVSSFTRLTDGADSAKSVFAGIGSAVDVLLDRFAMFGRGLVELFTNLPSFFSNVGKEIQIFFLEMVQGIEFFGESVADNSEEIARLKKEIEDSPSTAGLEKIKAAFKGIGDEIVNDFKAATQLSLILANLSREARLLEANQAAVNVRIAELRQIANDKLQDDKDRLSAIRELGRLETDIGEKNIKLAERQLAGSLQQLNTDKTRLQLSADALVFIDKLGKGQLSANEALSQAKALTLSDADAQASLNEAIDAFINLKGKEQEQVDKVTNAKRREAAITQEIANKEAKALRDTAKVKAREFKNDQLQIDQRIKAAEQEAQLLIESERILADANVITAQDFAAKRLEIEAKLAEDIASLRADIGNKDIRDTFDTEREKAQLINQLAENKIQREAETEEERNSLLLDLRRTYLERLIELKLEEIDELKAVGDLQTKDEIELAELRNQLLLEKQKEGDEQIVDQAKTTQQKIKELINSPVVQTTFNEIERRIQQSAQKLQTLQQDFAQAETQRQREDIKAEIQQLQRLQKAEYAAAVIQAFRNALERGEPISKAFSDAGQAVAVQALANQFAGFKEGGYTGDVGESKVAGVTHGKEYVIRAKETAQLGLKGVNPNKLVDHLQSRMLDYSPLIGKVDSYRDSVAKVNHLQIDEDGLSKKIGSNVAKAIPKHDFKMVRGHLAEVITRNGNKQTTITKNKNRSL